MPARCSHQLSSSKKKDRIKSVVEFIKSSSNSAQLSARLLDSWSSSQFIVGEAQLLLTLGADPTLLYEDDYGLRTINERRLSGSLCEACHELFNDFLDKASFIYEEMSEQSPLNIPRERRFLSEGTLPLCLDGGGVRGLVSVVCLLFTSKRLFGDESLIDIFDWLVGTSTGSMLAFSIAKGLTLTETFFLYWDLKDQIFLEGSTMSRLLGNQVDQQSRNMDAVLLATFPVQTMNGCKRRLTVPALDISSSPASLHIFRNYAITRQGQEKPDFFFRDIARASSAAPTYFNPHVLDGKKLVDGSLVANCPLNVLFKEVDSLAKHGCPPKVLGVLSIGTGEPVKTERKYTSGTNLRKRAKSIAHLSTLILEQVVGHDQSIVEMARERCHAQNIPFFRLSPKGISVRIDQVNDEKLLAMIWTTLHWLAENAREVDSFGELLYKILSDPNDRKKRSNTIL